jgi:gliding motility-associated-like protein
MKRKLLYFGFILIYLFPDIINAQADSIRNIHPVLTSVSVQPETGFAELTWSHVPSSFVAGFRLLYIINDAGFRFKTVMNPNTLNYIDSSRIDTSRSVSYQIEAIDITGNPSQLSNILNTMFSEVSVDSCNKRILVKWNIYSSPPKKVTDYSILVSVTGGTYSEAGRVTPDMNSFVLNNFINDAKYCFIIRANLEDGTYSTSNKACLITKMQRPPDWINADYATVNGKNNISLSFSIDPHSEINSFRLERKTENENDFSLVSQIESVNRLIMYTDNKADPFKINYYRLLAVNNCANPVVSSNLSCNIVPKLNRDGNTINLTWNAYKFWLGEVIGYKVYINTGGGFHEESLIQPTDTSYTLNYSSEMYDMTGNNLCFYISASETANPYGITGVTESAPVCTESIENITVPNTFTPNNDLMNDFFRPILSFTPVDYHLVITDRHNNILFESRDYMAQWDGKTNGSILPDGVYLWFLKVKTPSDKMITKSGTVTIIK